MSASPPSADRDRELLRQWVETWRRAGIALEAIRRRELQSMDTQEAIRQIFDDDGGTLASSYPTSGLVEQQLLFARLRNPKDR